MKTKYRLRKKTDFDGTWFYIERETETKPYGWWPIASFATEQRALEAFETFDGEKEEILKEKEV